MNGIPIVASFAFNGVFGENLLPKYVYRHWGHFELLIQHMRFMVPRKSNFVYFSDYTLADSTVEHKRLSATEPQNWGKSLTRNFEFKQDTLILTAHEIIAGQKVRLRWVKLK